MTLFELMATYDHGAKYRKLDTSVTSLKITLDKSLWKIYESIWKRIQKKLYINGLSPSPRVTRVSIIMNLLATKLD